MVAEPFARERGASRGRTQTVEHGHGRPQPSPPVLRHAPRLLRCSRARKISSQKLAAGLRAPASLAPPASPRTHTPLQSGEGMERLKQKRELMEGTMETTNKPRLSSKVSRYAFEGYYRVIEPVVPAIKDGPGALVTVGAGTVAAGIAALGMANDNLAYTVRDRPAYAWVDRSGEQGYWDNRFDKQGMVSRGSGNPLDDLVSPWPPIIDEGFQRPEEEYNLTGGDGDLNSETFWLTAHDVAGNSKLYQVDRDGNVLKNINLSAYAFVKGVAVTPNGLVVAVGSDLYKGHVEGEGWIEDEIINVDGTSDYPTDVDYAINKFFASTGEIDGDIYKIDPLTGQAISIVSISSGNSDSVDAIILTGYDNHMLQYGIQQGSMFLGLDSNGDNLGGATYVDFVDPSLAVQGVAHVGQDENAFMAIIYSGGVKIHLPLPHHPDMEPVCSPLVKLDYDHDCDIDNDDHVAFINCHLGPAESYTTFDETCAVFDVDSNGFVDLEDWQKMQECFSGGSVEPDPNCLE